MDVLALVPPLALVPAVALEEPQDFKHFKLVIEAPRDDAKLAPALQGVATIDREGHGWVSEAWLRQRDPGALDN